MKLSALLASASVLAASVALANPAVPGTIAAPVFDGGIDLSLRPSLPMTSSASGGTPVPPALTALSAPPTAAPTPVLPLGANPFASMQPAAVPSAPAANPFDVAPAPVAAPVAPGPSAPAAAFAIEVPAAAGEAPKEEGVDEVALRYYASQRDLPRVGAEIRRLRALYPDWQPPADLFTPKSNVSEQPLWDAFAAKDLKGVRDGIAAIRKDTPSWQPSADLTTKLEDAEAAATLTATFDRSNWTGVIQAAQMRPSLLVCEKIDMLWRVGEAFARSGNLARSFDLYSYILSSCDKPEDRLATVQKASALLPPQGIDALTALGRPLGNGRTEFEGPRYDTLRAAMGKVASGDAASSPEPAALQSFAAYVGAARSAEDAGLFGWYFYGLEQWASAAEWFKAASQLTPDPKMVEGYILALRNGDDIETAETVAYANRARSPEIAKIYVEIVSEALSSPAGGTVDAARLQRFEAVVEQSRSALGAQSVGWHLVADQAIDDARGWFKKSMEWEQSREAALGLAVVAARSKVKNELKAVKAQYAEAYPELADFKDTPAVTASLTKPRQAAVGKKSGKRGGGGGADSALMREANKQFQAGNYDAALKTLDERQARFGRNGGAEVLRGWTNLKLKRFQEARAIFKAEDSKRSTKDTRFGIGATFNSQFNAWRD